MAFAYDELEWPVYSNIISRGVGVHFDKNAVLVLKLNARSAPAKSNPKEISK